MGNCFRNSKSVLILKGTHLYLIGVFLLFTSLNILAEETQSINVNSFHAGLNSSFVSVEDALLSDQAFVRTRSLNRYFLYSTLTSSSKPWVIVNQEGNKNSEILIDQITSLDMGLGFLISDSVQFSFNTSVSHIAVASKFGSDKDTHSGDSRIQFKKRFAEGSAYAWALAPEIYLPSGAGYIGNIYGGGLSNSSVGYGAKLIGEGFSSGGKFTFNLGFTYFANAEIKGAGPDSYPRIDGRQRIFLGVGWLIALSRTLGWDNELSGNFVGGKNDFTPNGEFSTGLRYETQSGVSWHFGGGSGALKGYGGNDPRVYLGFKIPFYDTPAMVKTKIYRGEDSSMDRYFSERGDRQPGSFRLDVDTEVKPYPNEVDLPIIPDIEKKVIYTPSQLYVLEDVNFALNKASLTPFGMAVLNQVVKVLNEHLDVVERINIDGHTDHQGSDTINDSLSQNRANTVLEYLARHGIPREIMAANGFGSHTPLYDHQKVAQSLWEKNRRVEFLIREKVRNR
jgi:outer membrane protein OmpA-like peptidoglycan-associated protein